MTVNHTPPVDTLADTYGPGGPLTADLTDEVRTAAEIGSHVSTRAAMAIAAMWQSPGADGIGFARFASTGTVTNDLIDEIAHEGAAAQIDNLAGDVELLAALKAYVDAIPHADYPHHPGALYDCRACESRCFCGDGETECVHCAIRDEETA